jgi:hypothetical protein
MDLWQACAGGLLPLWIRGEFVRCVESQEPVATSHLVDNLAEQHLLEQLLETTKPPVRSGTDGLHYLLAAPFRYPPLRHGSRFGSRHEPSLFYGSLSPRAALAETAYYRFVFWHGMSSPPLSGRLLTQHTLFGARYGTAKGLRLHAPPCAQHRSVLTRPDSYADTQHFGSALRAAGVEAFEYVSARDAKRGLNVALFHPTALEGRAPLWQQPWIAETTPEVVRFSCAERIPTHSFPLNDFLHDDLLPMPAVQKSTCHSTAGLDVRALVLSYFNCGWERYQ